MSRNAMFDGLVVDEQGRNTEVSWVGDDACYVIDDAGFRRHIDAEQVDRQVLQFFKSQVDEHRDIAVRSMLQMLGRDDIFAKTEVEYQIDQMEEAVGQPMPLQAREMLRSLGFKIVIDDRGDLVDVELPESPPTDWF